jgi:transcription elongation GreA/GreB family factor
METGQHREPNTEEYPRANQVEALLSVESLASVPRQPTGEALDHEMVSAGSVVELCYDHKRTVWLRLVEEPETSADENDMTIAALSTPIAQAILGKTTGQTVKLRLGNRNRFTRIEILSVTNL